MLLLDNHFPDMEGIDALREIGLKRLPLPVVMVTVVGDEALVVQVLRSERRTTLSNEATIWRPGRGCCTAQ
jgi:DNA-binding NarL/FixJ family response regulator